VRKGERGIRILAPRPYTRTNDDGEEVEHLSFAAVAVFDASQLTEPPALPTMRIGLPDDQQRRYAAVLAAVLAAVQAEGIHVEERDDLGTADGFSAGGIIALRRGLDSCNSTLILLHEWSHELLHKGAAKGLARERKEAQAEATAYVVSRHFGLAHPFAADYLQSWQALTLDDLERELDAVVRGLRWMPSCRSAAYARNSPSSGSFCSFRTAATARSVLRCTVRRA